MTENILNVAKEGPGDSDSGRVLIHHPSLSDAIVVPLRPL